MLTKHDHLINVLDAARELLANIQDAEQNVDQLGHELRDVRGLRLAIKGYDEKGERC